MSKQREKLKFDQVLASHVSLGSLSHHAGQASLVPHLITTSFTALELEPSCVCVCVCMYTLIYLSLECEHLEENCILHTWNKYALDQ